MNQARRAKSHAAAAVRSSTARERVLSMQEAWHSKWQAVLKVFPSESQAGSKQIYYSRGCGFRNQDEICTVKELGAGVETGSSSASMS